MRPRLQYVQGTGWHCGRLLMWPVLLLGGGVGAVVITVPQLMLQTLLHIRIPFGLVVPAAVGWRVHRRLERKRQGEPFTYDPLEADSTTDWDMRQVYLADEPNLFWRLYRWEQLMWGSALALMAGLLVAGSFP